MYALCFFARKSPNPAGYAALAFIPWDPVLRSSDGFFKKRQEIETIEYTCIQSPSYKQTLSLLWLEETFARDCLLQKITLY